MYQIHVIQNKDNHLQTVFMLCIHSDTKGAVIVYDPTLKKIFLCTDIETKL